MGIYVNHNSLRAISGLNFRPKNEYNKNIVFSLIASILLFVLPFLPLWQWDFAFNVKSKTFIQFSYLNSAFNYRGNTWVWVIFILIGAVGIFFLLLLSPQNRRDTVKIYNKLIIFMLYSVLFGLIFGILFACNIFGVVVMIEAPAIWITLISVIIIGVSQIKKETWEKIRREILAYIFILPTVILMIFILYMTIMLSLFVSFQNNYAFTFKSIIFLNKISK